MTTLTDEQRSAIFGRDVHGTIQAFLLQERAILETIDEHTLKLRRKVRALKNRIKLRDHQLAQQADLAKFWQEQATQYVEQRNEHRESLEALTKISETRIHELAATLIKNTPGIYGGGTEPDPEDQRYIAGGLRAVFEELELEITKDK